MNYSSTQIATALNSESAFLDPDNLTFALNFELPSDGQIPEWVELIPAANSEKRIDGRDGRYWFMHSPQAVVDQSKNQQRDIVGDYEHASELKAPQGEEAPAAFWVKELEVRDGAIWGRIEWTPKGKAHIQNKEYRYLSPVFDYHRKTLEIYRLKSVGLTNKHNLYLPALNQETDPTITPTEETDMVLTPAMRKALGLKDDAEEQDALNAITALNSELSTAKNQAENPSLDKFVPRDDYNTAMNRAQTAEDNLNKHLSTARNQEIEGLVGQAVKDGKIAPASKDFYITACNQEGGIDQFKNFLKTAPTIAGDSGLEGRDADQDKGTALNAEEQQVADAFGNSAEDISTYGK